VITKRVTFLGWFVLFLFVVGTVFGIDVIRNGLGFIPCFCGVLFLFELVGLCFRKSRLSVRSMNQSPVFAGEKREVGLEVKALNKISRAKLALYPVMGAPDYKTFEEAREPKEEKRNIVDRSLKYYRWRWLVDDRGFQAQESEELAMEKGEVRQVRLSTEFYERGVWSLIDVRIKLEGVFGLLRRSLKTSGKRLEVYVAPEVVPVSISEMLGVARSDDSSMETAQVVGDSQEFLSLREYQPGDSWSQVNWKAMARTDKMMIQENEANAMPRYTIHMVSRGMSKRELETALSAVCSIMIVLSERGELGQVMISHGEGRKVIDWTYEREKLLRELAAIKYDVPWEAEGEPAPPEGLVLEVSQNGQVGADRVLIRIEGDSVNGIPIKEGIVI